MLLSTQDGIGCDLCKQARKEKFVYYSTEIIKINFDRSHKLSFVGDSIKECDICLECYDIWKEKIIASASITRSKCDLCGGTLSGERYVARLSYVEVDSSKDDGGIVETIKNYLLIDIGQCCIESILIELEKTMTDTMTPPPFRLKDVYMGDESIQARPVQWDGKDFADGEGRNERGEYLNAIAWQTTCPGCGQQIHFTLDDIYVADDGTDDNINCPHCKKGHAPDPMRLSFKEEQTTAAIKKAEEEASKSVNLDAVSDEMKKAVAEISKMEISKEVVAEVAQIVTKTEATTTPPVHEVIQPAIGEDEVEALLAQILPDENSPFVDPIIAGTFPPIDVQMDKLAKLNE